jgi:hypothetical protein
LGLAIADLGDDRSAGAGGTGLGLAVRDLRNNGSSDGSLGGTSLGLAIGDLGNDGSSGLRAGGTGLGLAVGDLRDDGSRWAGSSSLGLSVRDLGDDWAGRWGLGLAIGDLGDTGRLGDLGLTIADLGSTTTSRDHVDVNGNALGTSALAVQVVEGTRQALEEHSGARGAVAGGECERSVVADREAGGLLSTSLDGSIKLEPAICISMMFAIEVWYDMNSLVVGSDVSGAASLVLEDTILESQGQGTGELARWKITLGLGGGDIDGLDVEVSRGGSLATSRRALGQYGTSSREGVDSEGLHFQKIVRGDDFLTDVGLLNSEGW